MQGFLRGWCSGADDRRLRAVDRGDRGRPASGARPRGPGLWDYRLPVARQACDRYRIHRWEQRGCGRSGSQRPRTLARFTSDLDAIRVHFGYQRWIVGGHSFGTDLALIYICGTGIEWNAHRAAYQQAQRSHRTRAEQERLAYLTPEPEPRSRAGVPDALLGHRFTQTTHSAWQPHAAWPTRA